MDCSPPGSSLHGIFKARILEWVAISFSKNTISQVKRKITNWKRIFETHIKNKKLIP